MANPDSLETSQTSRQDPLRKTEPESKNSVLPDAESQVSATESDSAPGNAPTNLNSSHTVFNPAHGSDGLDRARSRSATTTGFLNYIHNQPAEAPVARPRQRLVSLYRLLVLELNLPGSRSEKFALPENHSEIRKAQEQLANMVKVPYYLEKFFCYGLLVCANAFLTLFTLVPLKIAIVSLSAAWEYAVSPHRSTGILVRKLHFVKRDLITLIIIISSVGLLCTPVLDVSRLYHDIRGQAHIKLYVMFGVLEVTDKLLSSIAQEVFTVLVGLPLTRMTPRKLGKLVFFAVLALAFFACHAYALVYQSVALHVAANSYSNALLALLLSNQFSELKGAVFKKFEREGLFQVAMSDLTERFQLSIMLSVIALRNLSQLGGTELGLIPDSWRSWNKWFGAIFGPSVVVLGSEILVDWVKHCYINRFNLIRPRIYENFLYVLSLDFKEVFLSNSRAYTLHEASDYVLLTKRIGLPIMSLTICFLRMAMRDLMLVFLPASLELRSVLSSVVLVLLAFVVLLATRLLLSLWLLKWAHLIKHNHEAYQQSLVAKAGPAAGMDDIEKEEKAGQDDSGVSTPVRKHILLHSVPYQGLSGVDLPLSGLALGTVYSDSCVGSPAESEIDFSFLPGVPNTESSSINPTTRSYLYDYGEKVPPTLEEKRNAQLLKRSRTPHSPQDPVHDRLAKVNRYEMSSKRIW